MTGTPKPRARKQPADRKPKAPAKKAARPRAQSRAAAGPAGKKSGVFEIEARGKKFTANMNEISALDELDLRRITGLTFTDVLSSLETVTAIAVLEWISLRQNGDAEADLHEILAATTLGALVDGFKVKEGTVPPGDGAES